MKNFLSEERRVKSEEFISAMNFSLWSLLRYKVNDKNDQKDKRILHSSFFTLHLIHEDRNIYGYIRPIYDRTSEHCRACLAHV